MDFCKLSLIYTHLLSSGAIYASVGKRCIYSGDLIVLASRRPVVSIALTLAVLLPLTACANSSAIQRAFSVDPNTGRWNSKGSQIELPADFPPELRYQNAALQSVSSIDNQIGAEPTASTQSNPGQQTRWSTPDPSQDVLSFYQDVFQTPGWQILRQENGSDQTTLVAQNQDLNVRVIVPTRSAPSQTQPGSPQPAGSASPIFESAPNSENGSNTQFIVQYARASSPLIAGSQLSSQNGLKPGDPDFIGPVAPFEISGTSSPQVATDSVQQFSDLDKAPKDLQPYIKDLAQLGVFTPSLIGNKNSPTSETLFNPNQVINHRTFARWLVEANNRIYRDRPARQIRLASETSQPAFRDISPSDPDFPYVQGLAEAGYIPSPLSGDNAMILFRPNAPLTREALLQWKVPVDIRQILPTATVDTVKQAWGFKDANRIAPQALQAISADYQNSDLSNIRRLIGSTLLFQPKKPVTRAEAAAALWYIGTQGDGFSAQDVLQEERQANTSSNTSEASSANSPDSNTN